MYWVGWRPATGCAQGARLVARTRIIAVALMGWGMMTERVELTVNGRTEIVEVEASYVTTSGSTDPSSGAASHSVAPAR
jgi:hypothetical protein